MGRGLSLREVTKSHVFAYPANNRGYGGAAPPISRYLWKEVGKLPQKHLEALYELLRSSAFAGVVGQAKMNGPTDFAGNVWRSLLDGQAAEVSTSPRDGGGQIPEVLRELSSILYEAR